VAIDLDSIARRDTLRVITSNTAATYFLHRGSELGLEYDLAKAFADRHGLHLQMVVSSSPDEATRWLDEGKGDIVASGFEVAASTAGATATAAYDASPLVVVTRDVPDAGTSATDAEPTDIHVAEGSRAHRALAESGESANIVTVAPEWDAESLLQELVDGRIEAALVPLQIAHLEQIYHPELIVGKRVGASAPVAWLVRPNAKLLAEAVNVHVESVKASGYYNLLRRKYLGRHPRHARYMASHAKLRQYGTLSAYDTIIQDAAAREGVDWRLVAAQISQESGFNSRARSWAGALGLMQLMPRTARIMGARNPMRPRENVDAGVRYLAAQTARFEALGPDEAVKFGLASYNAGPGHVADARRLAAQRGLEPDRWESNVAVSIRLLEQKRHYQRARYGYCRGSETVAYVGAILRKWEAYRAILDQPPLAPLVLASR